MRRGFSLFEVGLIGVLIAVVSASATIYFDVGGTADWLFRSHYPRREYQLLQQAYGPAKNSIGVEEWAIRHFFQDRRDGLFLDVGASHYRLGSNTYFLEVERGWSGVAIDARAEFGQGYAEGRPKTRFVAMFASDAVDRTAKLFVPASNIFVASQAHADAVRESGGEAVTEREVPTTTLNHVLEQAGLERVHFVNLDIEGAEPQALAGFDIEKYQPELVCVESHQPGRQAVLDYFHRRGYVVAGAYLRADTINLYFTPADHPNRTRLIQPG